MGGGSIQGGGGLQSIGKTATCILRSALKGETTIEKGGGHEPVTCRVKKVARAHRFVERKRQATGSR